MCNGEQRCRATTPYAERMTLEYTKASFAAAWVLAICAIGLIAGVTFATGLAVVAAVAVLPPVVMWRLWTTPRESMSESIREAIR